MDFREVAPKIHAPEKICLPNVWFLRLPVSCIGLHQGFEVNSTLYDAIGNLVYQHHFAIREGKRSFQVPVWPHTNIREGKTKLVLTVTHNGEQSSVKEIEFTKK